MTSQKLEQPQNKNKMRDIKIERVVLSCGATGDDLAKSQKLLNNLSGKNSYRIASTKRIPNFHVRPGLEVGVAVTIRGKDAEDILRKLLGAINNVISKKQITQNHFSFGIKEYVEIPGVEYQRDIGIRGLSITVVFARPGLRVKRKKIKSGKVPQKQFVSKEEIIKYMEEKYKTQIR